MNLLARFLRSVGLAVPNWLPHGTAVGNRVLKPIYGIAGGGPLNGIETWRGLLMNLDPLECIGGNLFFSPHLYDRLEREWIDSYLPDDGIFVDIGANIGAYSLWASSRISGYGRIIAIEADPANYKALVANIALNPRAQRIEAINIGVADCNGELPFWRNVSNNAGGHSFVSHLGHQKGSVISVRPLHEVLGDVGVDRVDLMKIDIEGFERVVLRRFFSDCSVGPDLRPRRIIIEVSEGSSGSTDVRSELFGILTRAGYSARASASGGLNILFECGA